ncbi:MAG: metallophosphoesterase family protein, partial [Lachnospiraceae bacterium]
IDAKQEAWLKDVFRENFGQGTIIVFHHPIVWEIPQLGMPVSESFAEIIKNSDTIGILCGHTHSNNIRNWNGVTQYTADSLAFGMEVGQDNIAFVDKVGINIYNIEAQEISVHTESINPAKQVFAEFSMADMMKFMK